MTDARWGSMAGWLRFHMVTGLVGPYMVLLHTAMRFNGLAGVAMLLTVVAVISGLIGRYLYTTAPHLSAGAEEPGASGRQSGSQRGALATWHTVHVPLTWASFAAAFIHAAAAMFYATLQR
jgi:cytochrome b561